jgi:hypothetical protein
MLVIVGGRQAGKTVQMIEWVTAKPDRTIMCIDRQEAQRLKKTYGLSPVQVTWPGPKSFGPPERKVEIGIDNAEFFLQRLLPVGTSLGIVSLTGPEGVLAETDNDPDSAMSFTEEA